MFETLHDDLRKRGWQSGTYRGFLRQVRGGIEWQVGHGRSGRLELRWSYRTSAGSEQSGEETLSENANRAELEDIMTGIYLRVHEKPDPTRVFGGGKRQMTRTALPTSSGSQSNVTDDPGQESLDI